MPLNIISNFAAQVAHRNLSMSDKGASSSVAKISAGTRVLAARDDAAALAIGSRLRAEVAAMTQASVNAGQAVSMLQIADGAMSQINDTLVRMKSLAVQAGSDQLGSTERSLINTEFQQLLAEVERIASDTEFNGQTLISGGTISKLIAASDLGTDGISKAAFSSKVANSAVFQYSYAATNEILTVTKLAVDGVTTNTATDIVTNESSTNNVTLALASTANADDAFNYTYDATTEQFTVTNVRTGENATIDITAAFNAAFGSSTNVIGAGETLDVDFGSLGVTLTLDDNFDRTSGLSGAITTGLVDADPDLGGGAAISASSLATTSVTATILAALAGDAAYNATTGDLTLTIDTGVADVITLGTANFSLSNTLADGTAGTVTNILYNDGNGAVAIASITHNFDSDAGGNDATLTVNLNNLLYNVQANSSGSNETVQIDLTNQIDAVAGTGQNLQFDQTLAVDIAQFGVTLTLDKGFDRTANVTTTTGAVTEASTPLATASFAPNSGFLNAAVYDALLALGYDSSTGIGYNSTTGILSLQVEDVGAVVRLNGLTGVRFDSGVAGENSGDFAGTTATTDIAVVLASGSSVSLGSLTGTYTAGADETGLVNIQLGRGVFYNQTNANALTSDFTFKIGTGNEAQDRITLSLKSVNQQALGINGIDTTTSANSDAASTAISNAISVLNEARANVGAFQNRLEIATSNLATARENTEAARSALLDLDIAAEMTRFTSQQILVQAGVSMLAQANQLPQNLLRLLQ